MLTKITLTMYLIDIFDKLSVATWIVFAISAIISVILLIVGLALKSDDDTVHATEAFKMFRKGLPVAVISLALGIIIPGKSVMYCYLGANVIDQLTNNEIVTSEAKTLYDDVKLIIHNYTKSTKPTRVEEE